MNTWPAKWTEATVRPVAKRLLRTPSFAKISWDSVRSSVLEGFPSVILPCALDGIQITELVKPYPDVESAFFRVSRVVSVADLSALLQQCNWFQLKLEDVQYIARRLETFPDDARVHLLGTSIFGVGPSFMKALTPQELEQLLVATAGAVAKCAELATNVGLRRAKELLILHKVHGDTFYMALGWLLTLRVTCIVRCLTLGFMQSSDLHRQFIGSPVEEQFETVIDELWRLVEGTSSLMPPGAPVTSTPLRGRYPTRQALQNELRAALRAHRALVLDMLRDIDQLVPSNLLIVAEPLRADASVFNRFGATMTAIENQSEGDDPVGASPATKDAAQQGAAPDAPGSCVERGCPERG